MTPSIAPQRLIGDDLMFWRRIYKRKGILSKMRKGKGEGGRGKGRLATEYADTEVHTLPSVTLVYTLIC